VLRNCRELAARQDKPEDWADFSETAQTWGKLADLHELTRKLEASGALLKKPGPGGEQSR
jgi:hypothetical protein